jgi:hypothetical protein
MPSLFQKADAIPLHGEGKFALPNLELGRFVRTTFLFRTGHLRIYLYKNSYLCLLGQLMCQFSDCKENVRFLGDFVRGVRKKAMSRLQELVNFCPGEQKMSIWLKVAGSFYS